MNYIEHYLEDILRPALMKYGISEAFIVYTSNVIRTQMISLIRHWNDRSFRSTVLLIGLEEGSYYEPVSRIDVRCFVVVTIRNSPIETLQSDAYKATGLTQPLSNSDIKKITGTAIRYFCKLKFEEIAESINNTSQPDIYLQIKERHPCAWTAMQNLALSRTKTTNYQKIHSDVPFELAEVLPSCQNTEDISVLSKSVFDGSDDTLDAPLIESLSRCIAEENGCFFIDSFKMLTRNVTKLFRVMEFILSRNHAFVTANYYIENGHIEKRLTPLRAAHSYADVDFKLSQTFGLGRRHKDILIAFRKQMNLDS